MKIVVYTCITENYDTLKTIPLKQNKIDYICFTDNPFLKSNVWTIKPIPSELKNLSNVKQQRIIKACPHKFLKEYDISLWIDGNIQIIGDMMKFINSYDLSNIFMYTRKHPSRKCIYEEAKVVINKGKDTRHNVNRQMCVYFSENFPRNYGLKETNIILRNHSDMRCKLLCNMWASQILKYSHRDQLSFDYCRWKMGYDVGFLDLDNILNNNFFKWSRHG